MLVRMYMSTVNHINSNLRRPASVNRELLLSMPTMYSIWKAGDVPVNRGFLLTQLLLTKVQLHWNIGDDRL